MFYIDTSVLVTALTFEDSSDRAQTWLEAHSDKGLAISYWVTTEFSSALSRKRRAGYIDEGERASAQAAFLRLASQSLQRLDIFAKHFQSAASFVDSFELGLRASDALHAAIAFDYDATVATFDRKMAGACNVLGIKTHLL